MDEKRGLTEGTSMTGSAERPTKRLKLNSNLSSGKGDQDDEQKKSPKTDTVSNPVNTDGDPSEVVGIVNPDEYVRVIPVSRKPPGEQQIGWHPVQLSKLDKASQMEVSECRTRVTSRKGYRMVSYHSILRYAAAYMSALYLGALYVHIITAVPPLCESHTVRGQL